MPKLHGRDPNREWKPIGGSGGSGDVSRAEFEEVKKAIADLGGTLIEPADDDIPKVYFTGTLPTSKGDGDVKVKIRYISKTDDFSYPATLKVQGGSSAEYPKKNFTLKLYEDETYENKVKREFKGWGKLNKFVLKAHWIDHSHVRNVGTAKIWGKIVKSRSDYDSLPEELRSAPNNGATDGFTCKVFANGVYQGLYEWIVPKDKLFGQDSDVATHSILNSEWNNQPTCAFSTTSPSISGNWSEELQDSMSSDISTSFANLIKFVAGSTDEEFVTNAENYFDVQSVIDFNIFARVFCIVDNLCRNQIFFTYDGVKWYEGCWDVDAVLGLPPTVRGFFAYNTEFQSGYIAYKDFGVTNMLYKRVETLFVDRFKARYSELRADVLSDANIIDVYERLTDVIKTYDGLSEEDYAQTTADGAFGDIPYTKANNIQQIRAFVAQRLPYMDEAVALIGTDNEGGGEGESGVACTGITLSTDTLLFISEEPQMLTATVTPENCTETIEWVSSDEEIANVNGGTVTPNGDGSCIITATCGNFSASCVVTVQDGLFGETSQLVPLENNIGVNANNSIFVANVGGAINSARFATSSWDGFGTSDYVELLTGYDCIKVVGTSTAIGFYDSERTLIGSCTGQHGDYLVCAIPADAVYFRVCVSTKNMTNYAVSVLYGMLSDYVLDVTWKDGKSYKIDEDGSITDGTYYASEKVMIPEGRTMLICDSSNGGKFRFGQIGVYDSSDMLLGRYSEWISNYFTAKYSITDFETPSYAHFAMGESASSSATMDGTVVYAL